MGYTCLRVLARSGPLHACLAAVVALIAVPAHVHACGGLFCSANNQVNQAAEQIIFADDGNGTVTAVIQIQYEGPAHQFAWVLPVPGKPEVRVSSELALNMIKQATNPTYNLSTTFQNSCKGTGGTGGNSARDGGALEAPGVSVIDSGAVGPYLYTTIEVDTSIDDRAQTAVKWLLDNGYDVGSLGPEVLRPYLDEGLNLLAFKLDKENGSGSIRPVMISYESQKPSIPIRPTAVAANDDMGVLVYLLGGRRGVPENYKALELNEALIDWTNANNNYNDVVSHAADEAMGQGFVTEYAGFHLNKNIRIFDSGNQAEWDQFRMTDFATAREMIMAAQNAWGTWDGFAEALGRAITLPAGVSMQDFQSCPSCYLGVANIELDMPMFLSALDELVIKPMADTQTLFDDHVYLTRLYTTMSADEMTMDPVFTFNPDLHAVDNVHTATRILDCNSGQYTIALPEGGSVSGTLGGDWPRTIGSQPAARRILQYGSSGAGKMLEDRSEAILELNPTPSKPANSGSPPGASPGLGLAGSSGGGVAGASDQSGEDSGGCNTGGARNTGTLACSLLACFALLLRRRRGERRLADRP